MSNCKELYKDIYVDITEYAKEMLGDIVSTAKLKIYDYRLTEENRKVELEKREIKKETEVVISVGEACEFDSIKIVFTNGSEITFTSSEWGTACLKKCVVKSTT